MAWRDFRSFLIFIVLAALGSSVRLAAQSTLYVEHEHKMSVVRSVRADRADVEIGDK